MKGSFLALSEFAAQWVLRVQRMSPISGRAAA